MSAILAQRRRGKISRRADLALQHGKTEMSAGRRQDGGGDPETSGQAPRQAALAVAQITGAVKAVTPF